MKEDVDIRNTPYLLIVVNNWCKNAGESILAFGDIEKPKRQAPLRGIFTPWLDWSFPTNLKNLIFVKDGDGIGCLYKDVLNH